MSGTKPGARAQRSQSRAIDPQRIRRAGRSAVTTKRAELQEDAEALGLVSKAQQVHNNDRLTAIEAALKAAGLMK